MSAGQMPSGSDGLQEWMKIGGTAGAAVVGANSVMHNHAKGRHDRIPREQKRGEALHKRLMTADQYVMYCSRDNMTASEIKEGLLASGGIHEGHDFSLADSFYVEGSQLPSANFLRSALDLTDSSCRLVLCPKKSKKKWHRLRGGGSSNGDSGNGGGDTPTVFVASPAEAQTQLEDGREVKSEECQYSANMPDNVSSKELPNMSYDVSEVSQEYYQGLPVTHTFTATRRYRTPDGVYYAIAIALALGGYYLFDRVKRASLFDNLKSIYKKLTGSKDSQQSVKALEENGSGRPQEELEAVSVEEFKRLQGEKRELEAKEKQQTVVRPEFLLDIFTSYKRGTITKGAATRILMNCYHLSEAEALEWLDKK